MVQKIPVVQSQIHTPQAISSVPVPPPDVVYAEFGYRLLALCIDLAILFGIYIAFFIVNLFFILIPAIDPFIIITMSIITIMLGFMQIIVFVVYPIFFIGSRGQTPGKMAMGIRVVKVNSNHVPGYLGAFFREILGRLLSSFLFLGYLWMLWDDKKQTWHDKLAGTVVVKV